MAPEPWKSSSICRSVSMVAFCMSKKGRKSGRRVGEESSREDGPVKRSWAREDQNGRSLMYGRREL